MMNVQGMTAEDTAEALGISEATVKIHLKNLFAKTGADRQSDLVRLAMAVLPRCGFSRAEPGGTRPNRASISRR